MSRRHCLLLYGKDLDFDGKNTNFYTKKMSSVCLISINYFHTKLNIENALSSFLLSFNKILGN